MFSFLIDSVSDTSNGQEAVGRVVWDGDAFAAVSGPYGNGYIEIGDYTVKVRNVQTGPDMPVGYCLPDQNGAQLCFFIPLSPNFSTSRTGIGIHPDGNVAGTEGCVGLQKNDFQAFWSKWNKTPLGDRPNTLTVQKTTALIQSMRASEKGLWALQEDIASAAVAFAIGFLGCRMGQAKEPLDANAVARLLTIFRAVSWVESKHGTVGPSQPIRDPAQCGNPKDPYWKELTGQLGEKSRFIRGPGLSNLYTSEIAAAAEASNDFDAAASLSLIGKISGHDDAGFSPHHSYVWAILWLIHRINTTPGDPAYLFSDLSDSRLIAGAVAYNGRGVANYEQLIKDALQIIGGLPALGHRGHLGSLGGVAASLVEDLVSIGRTQGAASMLERIDLTLNDSGGVARVIVEFR
ncbi:hypothetical protein [Mesorhizobium sp. M8A.F.Ca.ET.165.01.1.1]|uniref:hypothetical protein n=1 Tax=Mesorhizobium sp. M8A.F.Ca.ET.165.01.1.1 TaxID=2563960 RepID=UPI001093722D|nr:hypothetical protein [Mesorhizobium sp. M8A.F.Ca.ET.165.01.1.1]TGT46347.1 hypothetical protein EN808_03420 [Mesorhizobium sp. M8A.F.Ca.ET.165.01.1.1]